MKAKEANRSFTFRNAIRWTSARRRTMTNNEHQPVRIGSPPQFSGTPDVRCPEELLLGAVNSCLMLITFLTFAKRRQIEISAYESDPDGTVEKSNGKYRETRIKVEPVVSLNREIDITAAQEVFREAKEACIVSNSVLAQVDLASQFKALVQARV
jgi:organic hydroperoxide reductase OsmC/OhrA